MSASTNRGDGMNYAPKGESNLVVEKGEFRFAAAALDHGHIYGQCNGLIEAGGELATVYDPDPAKVQAFQNYFPDVKVARSLDEILADDSLHMVAAAAIPCDRGPLGVRVMEAGKLIDEGVIGRVIQVIGLGPHRLNIPSRPAWFFEMEKYGGILCDIGSHQIEQFLYYSGAKDATVRSAAVANYNNPEYPELEDFGEVSLVADNGCSNYFRVDWFTPDGLSTWGDGRTIIMGTDGFIELRKYIDIARDPGGDHLYLVNQEGVQHMNVAGTVGFPFFGDLILEIVYNLTT